MTDAVFKVSQLGYDVKTAADNELLFNSSWPLLKIAYEGDYVINSDTTQSIYAHNLGYPAAFFINDYTNGYATSNATLNQAIGINNSQLQYFGGAGAGSLTFPLKIHFYVYLLDLTSNYTGPIVNQSFQVPGANIDDVVIKVARPNKSISSYDYRDYSIHSGTQSPMIHMIVSQISQTTNSGNQNIQAIIANHNLGYLPLFFPFVSDGNGNYKFTGNYTQSVPRVFGDTTHTQIELGSSNVTVNPACLIVFKDPYSVDIPNLSVTA